MPDSDVRQRIRRLERACGCRLGAALLIVTFGAYPFIAGVTLDTLIAHPFRSISWWLVATIAAAAVGKLTGLAIARVRLRWLRRELARTTSAHA